MKIKSYFSRSPETAMAMARQEMGPEAVLVESRKAPSESRHLGEYEVVFAVDAPTEEPASIPTPVSDRLSHEVAELKRELEGMRQTLTRTAFAPSNWPGASPSVSEAYALLTASDVAPDLAREIAQAVETRLTKPTAAFPRVTLFSRPAEAPRPTSRVSVGRALAEELESRFRIEPALGKGEVRPRVVALVGPPGAGKTSTLIKLAVSYGLGSRRPVQLLSMDTHRIAAAEQLRSFGAILGVSVQILDTVTTLAQTIEENRGKELIFIDTPGLAADDLENCPELAHFLSTRPDIDTQLVLSASTKSADLSRMVKAFDVFRPQRLLFTRLDETATFGSIFNEAARTGKPLSFFTHGQRIPEDLETASHKRLIELILTPSPVRSRNSDLAKLG